MPEKRFMQATEAELLEKGSRFIGLAYPCESISEFKKLQADINQKYADATHITFAYRIQDAEGFHVKCSDAGEPSGTAGRPILSHIEGRDLINTAVFVIRYFGGTKLGAGGLVRAYGNTAKAALEKGRIEDVIPLAVFELTIPYELKAQLDYQIQQLQGTVLNWDYGADIRLKLQLPLQNKSILFDRLGMAEPES